MNISQQTSNKISILSFIATIMVVYRHGFTGKAFFESGCVGLDKFIQNGIGHITEIAVPYFFIVSGFFFWKVDYHKWNNYKQMITKKCKTLLVPFVFWNLLAIPFWLYRKSVNMSTSDILKSFFLSEPYGPLWYVRDLMVFMLLSPIISFIFSEKSKYILLVLLVFLLFFWNPVDSAFFSSEGFSFFILGGFIRSLNVTPFKINFLTIFGFLIIWLSLCFFVDLWSSELWHKISIIIGLFSCWNLTSIFIVCKKRFLYLSHFSFFIYVTHFYIIKTLKIFMANFFWGNQIVSLLSFLLLPIITVGVIIVIGKKIKEIMPNTYKFILGNR